MTMKQAQSKAQRLWGPHGYVGKDVSKGVVYNRFHVGVTASSFASTQMLITLGRGETWKGAFDTATKALTEGSIDPITLKLANLPRKVNR